MTTDRWSRRIAAAVALAAAAAGVAACGAPARHDLQVRVSFAPLEYLAERLTGPGAHVQNLTPLGADPHSQELSPAAVADLAAADLVVYLSGLQPATDGAIEQADPGGIVVDTREAATASLPGPPPPDPEQDPHFWLDPLRMSVAAEQITAALTALDPDGAAGYEDRLAQVQLDLAALDGDYRAALALCAGATLVTSHEAFGYLGARYGLQQEGIVGIDPEVEPSPARLRELAAVIDQTGVTTIFFESVADPGVAQTLAADLGLRTDVLDPMERPSDPDYLAVMRENLAALERGLTCNV